MDDVMAAFVLCAACSWGNCDSCAVAYKIEGLIGGWVCICTHTDEEREKNWMAAQDAFDRWFRGGDTDG